MFGLTPISGAPFSDVGSTSASVSLTGVVGTTNTPSVASNVLPIILGLSGTASVGSVTIRVNDGIVLVGVSGVGQVGTVGIRGWTTINDIQVPDWTLINT
jgi:hypothetical protein